MRASAFWAMVQRDLLLVSRDFLEFAYRVAMLPFMFILLFGFVLPSIGQVPESFPTMMFPGILGMSVMVAGIHGVAIPISLDFGVSREIEDRLLAVAPVRTEQVALAKMVIVMFEAWLGGLIVLPLAWVIMGTRLSIAFDNVAYFVPILVLSGLTSASLGLLLGTVIKPPQIPAMFPGFLIPMVLLGATVFPWPSLVDVPLIQALVLIDPLVYVSEAFRAVFTPGVTHIGLTYSLTGMVLSTVLMAWLGIKRFVRMAIG